MSIWNPYGFTIGGAPALLGAAPPALRVMGGQATAEQLAAARMAFNRFCAVARTSPVANPRADGRLPDGSAYEIVVVGKAATMTLWPFSDDMRNSGISFSLTYLDGAPIPGHVDDDGTPTIYLLTPRVKPGTRVTTGEWLIRKPKVVNGGKVVNADKRGLTYYAGISGCADGDMPMYPLAGLGLTGRAYRYEAHGDREPVYWNSRGVGTSGSQISPLPFLYTDDDGRQAMRLEIRTGIVGGELRYYIDLYKGQFGAAGSGPVGAFVSTLELERGLSIDHSTVTFRADGQEARAAGRKEAEWTFINLRITPSGVTATARPGDSQIDEGRDYPPVEIIDEESTSEGVYTREITVLGTDIYPTHGNGIKEDISSSGAIYLFDRRGKPVDINATVGKKTTEFERVRHSLFTATGGEDSVATNAELSTAQTEKSTYLGGASEVTGIFNETYVYRDQGVAADTTTGKAFTSSVEGTRYSWQKVRFGGAIISDPCYGFMVMTSEVTEVETIHEPYMQMPPIEPSGYPNPGVIQYRLVYENTTRRNELAVISGEGVVETIPYEYHPERIHVAFVAADPMTGALVVNVQEKMGDSVEKSWIFVVDDGSVKRLHQIMDVPGGTNVRVRSNRGLISV